MLQPRASSTLHCIYDTSAACISPRASVFIRQRHFATKMDGTAVPVLINEPLLSSEERSNGTSFRWSWPLLRGEMKKLLMIAVPMTAMNLLQSSLQFVSLIIVGHLSDLALSSVSVATSFANVTGFSFLRLCRNMKYCYRSMSFFRNVCYISSSARMSSRPSDGSATLYLHVGLASALETLCGQAFGAKQYSLHGVLMQRAIVVLFCSSIPVSIAWWFMEDILLAFDQDPSISFEAGVYARWLIPSLIAYVFLQPLTKFLQTQSIVIPMMLVSAFSLVVHAPLCWFLVYKTGLGIRGAALSTCISYWLSVVLLSLYIKFSDTCKKTRTTISKEAFHDITSFLKIAIPSTVMTCLDWWCFEILVLLAGILPNPELEASILSICLNTAAFAYTIAFGLGAAASTRISNELGAGNARGAVLAARAIICISLTEITIRGAVLFSLKNVWGRLYSNDSEVIQYMSTMMPILASSSMMDGLQAVLLGISKGCGLQKWGAFVNIAAYYVVGLPLVVIFGFVVKLGAKGLWLGILGGLFTQIISLFLVNVCHDWNQLAKRARERVYESALAREALCKEIV